MQLKLLIRNIERTARFPVPVVVGNGRRLGTATFNPKLSTLELPVTVPLSEFGALSRDMTLGAQRHSQSTWYIESLEVVDSNTDREHELADALDKASVEAAQLSEVASERLVEITELREKLALLELEVSQLRGKPAWIDEAVDAALNPESPTVEKSESPTPEITDSTLVDEKSPMGDSPESPTETPAEAALSEESLKAAGGMRELRKIAGNLQVPSYKGLKKEEDLIAAILAHAATTPEANG